MKFPASSCFATIQTGLTSQLGFILYVRFLVEVNAQHWVGMAENRCDTNFANVAFSKAMVKQPVLIIDLESSN